MKQITILVISIIIFLCAGFAASKLEIVSNMEDMLPENSISLLASNDYNQYFEGQDQAVIVVKKTDPQMNSAVFQNQAEAFLTKLASALKAEPYINSIFYQVDTNEMSAFSWAYIDMDTYQDLESALDAQDFKAINQILGDTEKELSSSKTDTKEYIVNDNSTHYLMFVRPVMDQSDYMGSRTAFYDGVQAHIKSMLEESGFSGLGAGLTGGAFIQDIEADTVAFDGLFGTMGITLLLILAIVILFFGGLKLPLLSLYPLALGAVAAAASAYLIYGSLNMFAVSFALLLLGLGIDYAVHLITRYQEERQNGLSVEGAVSISRRATGGSIIIGAATTALAFASFAFAKFKAFEQMGIVSAVGIISLCVGMLFLIPTLIQLFDRKSEVKQKKNLSLKWMASVTRFFLRRKWIVGIVCMAGIAALVPSVVNADIQSDISAIYPDNIPSLSWATEMESAFDYDIDTISFYADDEAQLNAIYANLQNSASVTSIDSAREYMPENVDEKLRILRRLDTTLQRMGISEFERFKLRKPTMQDLPSDIRANYIGKQSKLRVEIIPAINIYDRQAYDSLVSELYEVTGRYPVGMPPIMNEITALVKQDILMISLFCFTIAFIVAWLMFKRFRLAILAMFPLVLTLYITVGLLGVLHIEINAFSIAAFPLIIGIGVDSSIHLIHRLKEDDALSLAEKNMHTGKAIVVTALTTVVGFGSLAMINHPGMANLGLSVAIGIFISMLCTLLIVPLGFDLVKNR